MIPGKAEKPVLAALVGQPNAGKTSLFNVLTGKSAKTVNYPGSTVEYSTGNILTKYLQNHTLLDSPGIISLNPGSPDEKVAVDILYNHPKFGSPDFLIVVVDASQLQRHLLLVKQLQMCGFRIIIALSMLDTLIKKNLDIDTNTLSSELDCPVVRVDSRTGKGVPQLIDIIKNLSLQNDNLLKPATALGDLTHAQLIGIYNEIERVTSLVINPADDVEPGHPNLARANSQLILLGVQRANNYNECKKLDANSLRIDKYMLHPFWGLISFMFIMALIFSSIFWLAIPAMNIIDELFGFLASESVLLIGKNIWGNFISDGIISGVGSVMVFVPQIFILFFILGLLEDSGYLARGAMLIDKPLSKIGLNGKSFVPMLSGFACAIPAIMATRTIPNRKERFLTIFIIPLMSCSARLPVYALLIAYLIPKESFWLGGIVLLAIYVSSIVFSVIIASIVNRFSNSVFKTEDNSSFILELPTYKMPKIKNVISNTLNSSYIYLKKAGLTILAFSVILWILTYFPNTEPSVPAGNYSTEQIEEMVAHQRLQTSYAADLGHYIQPIMLPLGLDWRVGVALISAFAAREVFVSSLALIFKVTADDATLQQSILLSMREAKIESTGQLLFTPATIIGLIIFFVFALQCMSTLAVSRQETGSWRVPVIQLIVYSGIAYILAFLAVNILRSFGIN
ncbi:MAG: ferrous iron transport protein B [Ignavibacteriales bacterium]|nr:ferrous iron transport protein B [Ignavibacteriales bacterium]